MATIPARFETPEGWIRDRASYHARGSIFKVYEYDLRGRTWVCQINVYPKSTRKHTYDKEISDYNEWYTHVHDYFGGTGSIACPTREKAMEVGEKLADLHCRLRAGNISTVDYDAEMKEIKESVS